MYLLNHIAMAKCTQLFHLWYNTIFDIYANQYLCHKNFVHFKVLITILYSAIISCLSNWPSRYIFHKLLPILELLFKETDKSIVWQFLSLPFSLSLAFFLTQYSCIINILFSEYLLVFKFIALSFFFFILSQNLFPEL